ncbi:hypothetical protein Agub_g7496 [Astrephomene gubernaculifera]|uniref:RBR-type E3 ubiquitin transferase n=1 Tax=Astrephomene gubernaculifera TaxID=47775 RepID=A0AAD3DSW4_9CHLO|nr:hypothetical protein Agub_g7496 [Astrephomene gubernaculifera]
MGVSPSAHREAAATIECQSCADSFPISSLTCAGADAASSSSATAGCGHYFCTACMTEYVRSAVRERKTSVMCPMASGRAVGGLCRMTLSRDAVMALLKDHPADRQRYEESEASSLISASARIYCPHADCSCPLELADLADVPPDQPAVCPACWRAFCPRCRTTGWHQSYTCEEHQQLPPQLQSRPAEEAASLTLIRTRAWQPCPDCHMMVERSEGCNHMRCRCGAEFCYACGALYDSRTGLKSCSCALFYVPPDTGNVGVVGGCWEALVQGRTPLLRLQQQQQPQPGRQWQHSNPSTQLYLPRARFQMQLRPSGLRWFWSGRRLERHRRPPRCYVPGATGAG